MADQLAHEPLKLAAAALNTCMLAHCVHRIPSIYMHCSCQLLTTMESFMVHED